MQTPGNPQYAYAPPTSTQNMPQVAQELQSQGRNGDSIMVHMSPQEVGGLQALARMNGTSMTINPMTGMPEAFSLGKLFKKLIPTILGAGLAATGVGAPLAAGIVGLGSTALTGSLNKGLMAGLGAFGGASLAGAAGLGAAGTGAPVDLLAQVPASAGGTAGAAAPGFLSNFGAAASQGLGGIAAKAAPALAGLGLATPFMSGPKNPQTGAIDNSYQGPYYYGERKPTFAASTDELLGSSAERDYFKNDQPEVFNQQGQLVMPGSETAVGTPIMQGFLNPTAKKNEPMYTFRETPYGMPMAQPTEEELRQMAVRRGMFGMPMGMAKGGAVPLDDGAFVVDARTVSELGNGSSNAGQERLARLGGRPVRGPGDGVSDSIPARIGRDQPARIARDEVVFSREAVKRLGKGNQKKGAQKLYALMEKAHKARKKAKRGSDTKLAKGLSAIA